MVLVVENFQTCQSVAQLLQKQCLSSGDNFISLDCEWNSIRFGGRSKIALLALHHNGTTALIRLNLIGSNIPQDLKDLLCDSRIIKCGVGIERDADFLQSDYGLNVRPRIDLAGLAGKHGLQERGLTRIYEVLFNIKVTSNSNTYNNATANWEAQTLSTTQVQYANDDVEMGWKIYNYLAKKL